uniref:CSON007709 protein n=1 Tax=Culicoides sonorensis TaxID=179676 RepID=A0A336MYN5_CULSO
MWYGSSTILNNIMSHAIVRNNSDLEKQFTQNNTPSCLLDIYSNKKWKCDRLLMDCFNCNLTVVPNDLPIKVEHLVLSKNKINLSEDSFIKYINLKYIFLRNNLITTLPEGLLKYQPNLTRLYLNENKLTSIPENFFSNSYSLKWLFLDDNQLNLFNLTSLCTLKKLKWLELQHNNLTLEDQTFPPLHHLTELDLSYNKIKTINEYLFMNLGHLERL